MRAPRLRLAIVMLASVLCGHAAIARAQSETGGRVVLALPFDNRSGQPSLDWIGESFAEDISQRLQSSGFLTISRDDRAYALDHLGLPEGFRPSRATTIRIAQTLDAEFVIVGSYTLNNGRVSAQAQVLSVNQLRMSPPMDDSTDLARLLDLENSLAWKCARSMNPKFNIALQTFLATSRDIKLDAYENYIRGISTTNPDERMRRLKAAVSISPNYPAASLALGKLQYTAGQYDDAATTLAKVPSSSSLSPEANFYLGLSRFNSARYGDAANAFGLVASRLPLPEVVNNEGVAIARQKKDATPLLQRASSLDPLDVDYHFNVAVTLHRRGDNANARKEVELALKSKPNDPEAKELRDLLTTGKAYPGFDPQERIRRSYSEASFRQAAFQLDQMRMAKLSMLPPADQAVQYSQAGRDYLQQGLIPEAETEYQQALAADNNSAVGHEGLAEVRERTGDANEARSEAQTSIRLHPSVDAYLVLARVDLQENKLAASANDVSNALRLDPKNGSALGMKQALTQRGTQLP